ncbi:MAG: DUF934 domain-containing protein [Pseudomonadales bacterium]|nr:DUF934 domain-containing protein [Pseudomonadales bacterium]
MSRNLESRSSESQSSVLIDGRVAEDHWRNYCPIDHENLNDRKDGIIFPFEYWLENRSECLAYNGPKGVACKNTDDISQLKPYINELNLICIEFPIATDGRAYSQAHLLRQRHGYTNELRAVGEIEIDQLFLMTRCGINAFVFNEDIDLTQASKYLTPFSVSYQ